MGLFVVYLYDRDFGYAGANYYNTAFNDGMTMTRMREESMEELRGYGFQRPRVVLVRLV